MNTYRILILALIANSLPAWTQTPGATFLKIPVGARAAAMGSALTAIADDASAIYWNPAGLAYSSKLELTVSHNQWIAQTQQDFIGLAFRLSRFGTMGMGYLSLSMDPLDKRGESGENLGTFQSRDRALFGSFSIKLSNRVGVGGTLKIIEQTLDNASASGQALDIGILLKPHPKLNLGAALQNIGSDMHFVKESYPLPAMLRAGAGIGLLPNILLTAEGKKDLVSSNGSWDWAVGFEYHLIHLDQSYFWSPVIWRLGYLSPKAPGIGVGLKIFGSQLDYAFASMNELGPTHRVSLNLKFGENLEKEEHAFKENDPRALPQKPEEPEKPAKNLKKNQISSEEIISRPKSRVKDSKVFDWLRQQGEKITGN